MEEQLMRTTRLMTAALLTGAALLGPAATALADTPGATAGTGSTSSADSGASPGTEDAAPTEAGTAFRTATAIRQSQTATASASTGDYLYWMFPAAAGQIPTARATVTLPDQATRHGAQTWQIDVYDGLRRRQPCVSGDRTVRSGDSGPSVTVSCTLRTVRPIADPRSNDPLPGAYYVRLTVVDLPADDLGQPFRAEVVATTKDAGGAHSEGGELAAPLTPAGQPDALAAPEGGWTSGWWSDRWLWTAGGGVLGALAAIGGYTLTRHPRRSPAGRVPAQAHAGPPSGSRDAGAYSER
jgi:hypothetical protein